MNAPPTSAPCGYCGARVKYLGAEFCSPTCHEKAWSRPEPQACELCRGPLEVGQEGVCPKCASKVPVETREVFVLDCETARMVPGCEAPPLACVGWATAETYGLLHWREAKPTVVSVLEGDCVIVGHHTAIDMAIFCANWPDVIPAVFEAYARDRVTCTIVREKLIDIATNGWAEKQYNLGVVAKKRLGVEVDKKDEWRLRFGELIPYPLEQWPNAAKSYAQKDPVITFGIYQKQEDERQWLADQYRQARASFWIELMSIWGLHTDPDGVREFADKTRQEYESIEAELISVGLMREKFTKKKATGLVERTTHKNVKATQARMEAAWAARKGDAQPNRTTTGIGTDADNCDRSGDPLLEKYAKHSSIGSLMNMYIPILERGTHTPIHANFNSLLVTGRTSSSPNVQNWPTASGPRECFVPRPGWMYAIGDYSGMELRTWSQICIKLFKFSDMAVKLNEGLDCHTWSAANVLGISYEEALHDYLNDPKGRIYFPRQACKAGNFAFPGGGGAASFQAYAREAYGVVLTLEQAQETKRIWRNTWREAQKYLDWVNSQGQSGSIMMQQLFVGRFRAHCGYCDAANCLDAETEALTKNGWVKGFDLKPGDFLLTKNAGTGCMEWEPITHMALYPKYRGPLTEFRTKNFSAVTTPNHRWLVRSKQGVDMCKTTEEIGKNGDFRIHRTGDYVAPKSSPYTNNFVELVGWVLTDGSIRKDEARVMLYQSQRGNPHKVKQIDSLFRRLKLSPTRTVVEGHAVRWALHGKCNYVHMLRSLFPERILAVEFLHQLTKRQLQILFNSMMLGDGSVTAKGQERFVTRSKRAADAFQILCTLLGKASIIKWRDMSKYHPTSPKVKNRPWSKGIWTIAILDRDTVQVVNLKKRYGGSRVVTQQRRDFFDARPVWCPRVRNTYFVARRDGGVYLTGNTMFQGLAADCAKNAGFLIARACYAEPNSPLYSCRIVNFVHDEVILEIPIDPWMHERAMELARLMKLGADVYLPDVPSVVEPLLAKRWSKKAKPVHGPDGRLVPWDLSR